MFEKRTPIGIIFRVYIFAGLLCNALIETACSPTLSNMQRLVVSPEPATEEIPRREIKPTSTFSPIFTSVVETQTKKIPGEPHGTTQVIHDQTCETTASTRHAPGGDEYSNSRFERPFDAAMNYLPALDIKRAELVRSDDGWFYFGIFLQGEPALSPAVYGIELDLDIDGRGDLLIRVSSPQETTWTDTGIQIWWDSDRDVGGQVINRSDPKGYKGSGFETLKFDSANGNLDNRVWIRSIEKEIQIAVKSELLGGKGGKFTWKPYSDGNPISPTLYDINDYFLLKEAGSPLIGERDYPIKTVFAFDNTCRGLSGLTPSGKEHGVCPP